MTAAWPELRAKVSGEARYARDLVDGGAALCAFVRSPYPHAEIARLDVSAALRVPGVLAVLTGADFAGLRLGHVIADQPVLAEGRVRHVGEGVAAVCAESPEALAAGVAAVEVGYRPLPFALAPAAAIALGVAVHEGHPDNVALERHVVRGNWDAVAGEVAAWAAGTFTVGPQQHAPLEPYAALASYEPGRIVLHAPVHNPHALVREYGAFTSRFEEALVVRTPVIGGSFGAHYEHPLHLALYAFAQRLRRDVGFVLSRREDLLTNNARMGMTLTMRLGATAEGRIVAKECDVLADNGAYSLHGPSVAAAAAIRSDNLYRLAAVRTRVRTVYTNGVPSQCFRGFGNPQAIFAQEQLVDDLARQLRIDPIELRRRSATRSGDTTIHGWHVAHAGLVPCLDSIEAATAQTRPRGGRGRLRHGLGIACAVHVVSNRAAAAGDDFARVRLTVSADGRVRVGSGEVDVGAGTVPLLRRLVAGALEVPPEIVDVVVGATDETPDGLGSFASRTSFFAGNAALAACALLRERLRMLVGDRSAPLSEQLAAAVAHGSAADLDVTGEYVSEGVTDIDEGLAGNVSPTYTFAAHACEVTVDTATGAISIDRYVAAHDAGTVLDQALARGQVIGGVLQGMGYARFEEVVTDEEGRMLNPGFLDYRIPTASDSFPVEVLFVDTHEPAGPLGAKSIAEPPLIPVAGCLANAVADAVGERVRELPLSPERVLGAVVAG